MFVRAKTTPNSPRRSIQVVENIRDSKAGKVHQKIIRYVGIAMDDAEEAKLRAIGMDFIAKQTAAQEADSLFPRSESEVLKELGSQEKKKTGRKPRKKIEDVLPVDQVNLDMITEECRVIDGVHEVAGHLYDELNYNKVLKNEKYSKILKDLVLCRISNPTSKLATSSLLKRYYMKEHDIDSIYRTMDHVFRKIDDIRLATFESTTSLISGEVDIVLFDVTTLHFESIEVDELRKFGYSKNFRFNTTQVVLALATTTDGLPIGYELFEGNKAEVKTLIESIDQWKTKFKIKDVCFIGDRAMFSEANLKAMEEKNYKYIVAAKLRALPEVMQKKLMQEENYVKATVAKDLSWIGEFNYHEDDIALLEAQEATPSAIATYRKHITNNTNRRFVVSYNTKRARHDYKKRASQKAGNQLHQTDNTAKLISNAALKKYTSSKGKSQTSLDTAKVDEDAKWYGFHGVITNIEKETVDSAYILAQYRRLVKIEDCFRISKTTLKMRPIYHWKSERVRAHVAICYMAFALIRQLEYRVKLLKKLSLASIIEELNSVQSSIYVHKRTKDRYRMPGSFSNEARKIYNAIGVSRNLDPYPIL
ncbi:MAG: IS1634 family transposase [Chthoniobacterales bacterium]